MVDAGGRRPWNICEFLDSGTHMLTPCVQTQVAITLKHLGIMSCGHVRIDLRCVKKAHQASSTGMDGEIT